MIFRDCLGLCPACGHESMFGRIHVGCAETLALFADNISISCMMCPPPRQRKEWAMGAQRTTRYVHATWLPGIMTGEKHCQWAAWFKTNYFYDKAPEGDKGDWSTKHTILLTQTRKSLKAAGDLVLSEQDMKWTRDSGLVISGTADLIAIHPDGTGTVYDCKAAKPRQSHIEQVLLYMYLLPRSNPRFADIRFAGQLVYAGNSIPLEPGRIDSEWEERLNFFLDLVDTDEPPEKVPSPYECLYCKIAASDCEDRLAEDSAPEEAEELV